MKMSPVCLKTIGDARAIMRKIGVDPYGIRIMTPKTLQYAFKIEEISSPAANIIKQHLLSLGSDAALSRDALVRRMKTSILAFGTLSQMKDLAVKLRRQPFGLDAVAKELESTLYNLGKQNVSFRARGKRLSFRRPLLCGIINVTPDSFSGDGLLQCKQTGRESILSLVLKKTEEMARQGAKIIDVGGESSRPWAQAVSEQEEIKRVVPVVKAIRKEFPALFLSVDTYKYQVAKACVQAGVDIINDITAFRHAPRIIQLVRDYRLGCVIMHMRGTPRTMQVNPAYRDLMGEIIGFFRERVATCITQGLKQEQIMIDPGIGFGKTVDHNYYLLQNLAAFKALGMPVFVGVSRKSFIGKTLKCGVEDRILGTMSALVASYLHGAHVFRVHDVREAKQALTIAYRMVQSCPHSSH